MVEWPKTSTKMWITVGFSNASSYSAHTAFVVWVLCQRKRTVCNKCSRYYVDSVAHHRQLPLDWTLSDFVIDLFWLKMFAFGWFVVNCLIKYKTNNVLIVCFFKWFKFAFNQMLFAKYKNIKATFGKVWKYYVNIKYCGHCFKCIDLNLGAISATNQLNT